MMLERHQMTPRATVRVDAPVRQPGELPLKTFDGLDSLPVANARWWRETRKSVLDKQLLNQQDVFFIVRGALTDGFDNADSHG
jgi:hypothetical protein